ncbi:MAG: HtaA domain-containing protein [Gulosibacter sp.]|uniref:HtaA domain-containing protein n=1 Tax=Gulosibacter sp. TaxID=2817531 RepID=UPI003F8EFE8B
MTKRQNSARKASWLRRGGAVLGASAIALGAGFGAAPAFAAESSVDDVSFSWRVNDESGGGAFFGGCNFLVAGEAGDNGLSGVWSGEFATANYKTEAGNVTVTKPDADGNQVQPTWTTKCQNPAGTNLNTTVGSTSGNQVNFTGGSGTVDADADNASIQFDGSFTIVYYGGMTYWSISNPVLTVENGVGTVRGTASGYGADMFDPSKWVELPEQEIEVATLTGVDVTDTGIVVTPEYAGVEVEGDDSGVFSPQNRTKDGWGSFPQSWVDYNLLTGQSAYWYTSGGLVDPKKPAAPISIGYTVAGEEEPEPEEPGDENAGDIDVTIPETDDPGEPGEPGEPTDPEGEFSWAWDSEQTVDLGTASQTENGFVSNGDLNDVTITDTRTGGDEDYSWNLSGSVSEFTSGSNNFAGTYLGWTPNLVTGDADVVTVGDSVAPGSGATDGLASSKVLASSGAAASAVVSAGVQLQVPLDTAPGDYSATLTITAISE